MAVYENRGQAIGFHSPAQNDRRACGRHHRGFKAAVAHQPRQSFRDGPEITALRADRGLRRYFGESALRGGFSPVEKLEWNTAPLTPRPVDFEMVGHGAIMHVPRGRAKRGREWTLPASGDATGRRGCPVIRSDLRRPRPPYGRDIGRAPSETGVVIFKE
ncbi:hypothetical protein Ssi02_08230 [Sinosporangium siamense]|uniref:Uncharacterized protein n=1 Tax=Sinosporangium siamense TaxID=1367973 RepID=A0A919RBI5_9ACTN|nr:hypothetical protein Ssi02_08230 [Sinosporangium siamense]